MNLEMERMRRSQEADEASRSNPYFLRPTGPARVRFADVDEDDGPSLDAQLQPPAADDPRLNGPGTSFSFEHVQQLNRDLTAALKDPSASSVATVTATAANATAAAAGSVAGVVEKVAGALGGQDGTTYQNQDPAADSSKSSAAPLGVKK